MYTLFALVLMIQTLWSGHGHKRDVDPDAPIVDLGYSRYRGSHVADTGVDQFLGMRYATPPLGDLRFRAPIDPVNTSTVQDASSLKPICISTGAKKPTATMGEDCLFVNVFKPSHATSNSSLPVWVYIQGGGFMSNSNANFNGTTVIEESGGDIVFVNFNYRVGALGFLASEEVRANGDLNAGLLDQRKALEWVRKYISQFGGNPDHVVLHGASAGAASVGIHMSAYGGRNDSLFIGAAVESPFWPGLTTIQNSEFQFDRFVKDAGCSGPRDTMSCLRSADIKKIQSANVPSPYPSQTTPPLWYFLPVVDGDLVQDYLYRVFEDSGKYLPVPLLIGDDTDEGTYFVHNAATPADVSAFLSANYPGLSAAQLAEINDAYPKLEPAAQHAEYFSSAAAAYGDAAFVCPGNFMAESLAKSLSPHKVWNYRFNVQDPQFVDRGYGTPHTWESSAIFGPGNAFTLHNAPDNTYREVNAAIVPVTMRYWISFVKFLDPNPFKSDDAPVWEPWGDGRGERLKIETGATNMETVPQAQVESCELWKRLTPSMTEIPSLGCGLVCHMAFTRWFWGLSFLYLAIYLGV